MYTLMSQQTALLTECLITHFTCIWTLTITYITGISAFSTVCLIMFIWSTLVKTQMLNIKIYSDGENSYFYSNVYIR